MLGKTVGPYQVLSRLGQGGVGTVYLAKDRRNDRHVAMKMLHQHLVESERAVSRFVREAEVLSRLKHPNIVGVLDFLRLPEGVFIILEFVRGETLESGLQRLGAFAWERVVPWFVEALNALEFAHSQSIIHRDVKPANMLIEMSGHCKLLDFGMAKLLDSSAQLTEQGMTLGTVTYMSKEQLLGKPLDARSDFYSLGVALYEMVTGRLPFWSENDRELAIMIARKKPAPPSACKKGLPPLADELILKALNKKPEDRYQDAASFREALRMSLQSQA